MTEAVVDRLEMVDVEDHHRYRPAGDGFAVDHPRARLGEAAAIEHAGQGVHRCRRLVRDHRALGHQKEDDEHGADRIEHELDGESGHPDAASELAIVGIYEVAKQDRQHQHKTVHDRHSNHGPASLQAPAALGPQFAGR